MLFFSLASIWGCLLGATGLAVAMVWSEGARPELRGSTLGVLLGACALSVVGAAVAARAYREAASRRRS